MRKNRLFGRMAGLTSAALAAMAAAAPVMAAVSGSVPGGGNSGSGESVEETVEEEEDALRKGQGTEAEVAGAAAPGVTTGNRQETGVMTEENKPDAQAGEAGAHGEDSLNKPAAQSEGGGAETTGVYEFPDTKTAGTMTVVKKWDDQSTNAERPKVDVSISTQKPSKNPLGYTVTFHADVEKGLTFADGSTTNEVVYNGNGQIVSGIYKGPSGGNGVVRWYTNKTYKEQIALDENGQMTGKLTGDVDVWPKEVTFEVKGYNYSSTYKNGFRQAIPDTAVAVVFTDEVMPADATLIDVDADGDGGVVAWTEADETIMKVSTQIKGVKVQAAKHSTSMFEEKSKIQTIDLTNLDTVNVTSMFSMFMNCSGLTNLNMSSFDTSNVTSMTQMFFGCSNLISLDVSAFDTAKVTSMSSMFSNCYQLTSLDVSLFDTAKVTNMDYMFLYCGSLTSLDVSAFDTSKVKNMRSMFDSCSNLTNLNLSSFDTSQVTDMSSMFKNCSRLTNLDLLSFDTAKVTSMSVMFYGCRGLVSLDVSSFDTRNVTNMNNMFSSCDDLKSLDLSSFDTANVTTMGYMFSNCISLTSLDLSSFDTANVTTMGYIFYGCYDLKNLDLSSFDTSNRTNMGSMFYNCNVTSLTTGPNFQFVGNYALSGTWQNTAGETFTRGNLPSNVADTYTKIAS